MYLLIYVYKPVWFDLQYLIRIFLFTSISLLIWFAIPFKVEQVTAVLHGSFNISRWLIVRIQQLCPWHQLQHSVLDCNWSGTRRCPQMDKGTTGGARNDEEGRRSEPVLRTAESLRGYSGSEKKTWRKKSPQRTHPRARRTAAPGVAPPDLGDASPPQVIA